LFGNNKSAMKYLIYRTAHQVMLWFLPQTHHRNHPPVFIPKSCDNRRNVLSVFSQDTHPARLVILEQKVHILGAPFLYLPFLPSCRNPSCTATALHQRYQTPPCWRQRGYATPDIVSTCPKNTRSAPGSPHQHPWASRVCLDNLMIPISVDGTSAQWRS